jgi:hypothetical protein
LIKWRIPAQRTRKPMHRKMRIDFTERFHRISSFSKGVWFPKTKTVIPRKIKRGKSMRNLGKNFFILIPEPMKKVVSVKK